MKHSNNPNNKRLTTSRDRQRQHIIKSVVRRRKPVTLRSIVRSVWRITKVLILAAFVAGLYWGATEGYRRLFWENPDYSLKEVKFQSNGSLTHEQAVRTAGIELGRNIFSYQLDVAREKLRTIPQVATVEIRRYLPSRIEITVTERKPIAWVSAKVPGDFASAGRVHMVDARGNVFQPRRVMPEHRALPVVCGFDSDEIKSGNTLRSAEMETALNLLDRVRDTGEFRIQIIDLSKAWCMIVTDQKQTRITFGLDHLDDQLSRLAQVEKEAARYGQDLQTVNVMIVRNIPVTFVPPPMPEPDIDALLLGKGPKEKPAKPATGGDPSKPATKGGKPSSPPARKSEPNRGRETPKPENDGVLRPFRQA